MIDDVTTKVAIVGAGSVGATLAYAALMRGAAQTVALYDINTRKVEAEALDLAHGIQFMPMAQVIGSDRIDVCADADVVVVTAGAKQAPGQSRLELAQQTVSLTQKIMPQLVEVAPQAVFLLVTNPVDIVTLAAVRCSGLPRERVFGSGTVLDSSRLRYLIAQHCRVAVQNVHAYIAGEHGDSEIPLWSSASVGSVPLLEWEQRGMGPLSVDDRDAIAHEVTNSAYRIIEGKGATNFAIGVAASRIIEAVLNDEHRVLPVSSLLDGYGGLGDGISLDGVCLSLPTIVGRAGAEEPLPLSLSAEERAGLQASADQLRAVAASLKL